MADRLRRAVLLKSLGAEGGQIAALMGWEFLYLALAEARGWDRLAPAGIKTSFYAELDGAYARDTAIRVGDTLSLWTDTVRVDAAAMRYETVHSEAAVRVGAIVCYFPDTGIFPAGGSGQGLRLVAGPRLLARLLPNALRSYSDSEVRAIAGTTGVFYTNEYGLTDFYLNARAGVASEAADTALLVFARNHNMEIEVYRESSEKLLRDADLRHRLADPRERPAPGLCAGDPPGPALPGYLSQLERCEDDGAGKGVSGLPEGQAGRNGGAVRWLA